MTAHPPFARRSGLIALAALTLVGAACGPAPTPTPEPAAFDGRLLVHLGRPEPIQLIGIDGHGIEREVTTPEGGLRWFAAAPDGHLAGDTTTSLGRIQAPDPAVIGAVALDRTGDHLALGLAVADASAAGSVRVLDGTDGWSVVADRTTLAGAPIDALAFVP
jgi:hypothetical protein